MAFIHFPKVLNPVRSVILFENPLVEFVMKSPWYHVLLVYLLETFDFAIRLDFSDVMTYWFILLGFVLWTFFEVVIHKFVLHSEHFWLGKVGSNH